MSKEYQAYLAQHGIKYEKATSEFINKHKNVKLSDMQSHIRERGKQNKIHPNDVKYMINTHEPLKWKKIVEGK